MVRSFHQRYVRRVESPDTFEVNAVLRTLRWREDADGLQASFGDKRGRAIALALPLSFFVLISIMAPTLTMWAICTAWFALCVRLFRFRIQASFREGFFRLEHVSGALFRRPLELPVSEIKTFMLAQNAFESTELHVTLRSGATQNLALSLARRSDILVIVNWLNEALVQAQHEGGSYRIATGHVDTSDKSPSTLRRSARRVP
jgi:hypothetical protein